MKKCYSSLIKNENMNKWIFNKSISENNLEENKGISLIALIITIIVIVILATVVLNISISTPESANFARFVSDLSGLQDTVSIRYSDIYIERITSGNPVTNASIYSYMATGTENESATGKIAITLDNKLNTKVPIKNNEKGELQGYYINIDDGMVYVEPGYTYQGRTYHSVNDLRGTESSGTEDIKQLTASNINISLEGAEIIDGSMNVQLTYDANANFAGEVLTNADKFQYRISDGAWKTAIQSQKVLVPLGSTLRVRYYDGTNGYKETSMLVGLIANNIEMQLQNNETNAEGKVAIEVTYDENIKLGDTILSNTDRFQYKIGDGAWRTATANQTMNTTADTTVYARYFDGTNGYKETSIELVNNELVFRTDPISFSPDVYNIPAGVKTVYAIVADCTDGSSYEKNVSGTIIVSGNGNGEESHSTNVDTSVYGLRATEKIYKLNLTGEAGTITISASGGAGVRRSWVSAIAYYPVTSESNKEIVSRNVTINNSGRGTVSIPSGVKTAYAIFSTGTSDSSQKGAVSGSIINSQSVVIADNVATKVFEATAGYPLRSSLKVIKMDLSGEAGTITTTTEYGFGDYLAWTAQVIYCK